MALTKPILIRPNWSQIGRKKRRERGEEQKERRRGRGRGRREEEEEKPRSRGMELWILYGTTWAFKAWNCFPYNCIVISLFPKT